jgi:hypothetical protein
LGDHLVNDDNNGEEDVFLYDKQRQQITRVSVAASGTEATISPTCRSFPPMGAWGLRF